MRLASAKTLSRIVVACALLGAALLLAQHPPGRAMSLRAPHPVDPNTWTPIPKLPAELPRLTFFAVGDTGWKGAQQAQVAREMALHARAEPPEFVLLLGDNFYRSGVASTDDPMWTTHFESAFGASELQVPFYAALGNHDYDGNVQAQVEYTARGTRWRMPAQYYAFSRTLGPDAKGGSCDVEFFVLDTTPVRLEDYAAGPQVRWLEEKLARSTARWKIVVGHHPIVSGGRHGGSTNLASQVEPLFDRYGIDLYLSGHDHDLQLLRTRGRWLQVVSGAGSSTREAGWIDETVYSDSGPGFVCIVVTADDLWIEFRSEGEDPCFVQHVSKAP